MTAPGRPSFSELTLDESLHAWASIVDGVSEYWNGAVARQATPWSIAEDWTRWWQTATHRTRPSWHTPHSVAFEAPLARLRDFSTTAADSPLVPTLVLPPQAGHDSCIVDFAPEQSQVQTILAAGLSRAYALDWIGATSATAGATVEDYLAVVDRAVQHIGGSVNLVGDCQGGWLAAIYTALHPERINTLTIAGAPIDFHAGDSAIHSAVKHFAPTGDLAFYRALVASGGGVLKGEHMLGGFILLKPDNEFGRHAQLLANIRDSDHVERYRQFEDWFKYTQDIPGDFYLWIVEQLFRDNQLIHCTLRVAGDVVDLSRISCPINLFAGAADHITPADQVYALADAVGTPGTDVVRRLSAGGHLGLFMGREALRDHWPPILADVAARSLTCPARR